METKQRTILKAPNIDFKRIHPMLLIMGQRKLTQGKVSLYFHDVVSWLKSAQLSLSSYRDYLDKLKDKSFIDKLNKGEVDRYEYLETLTFFLENAVVRLSAIRDKLAITALIYYLHPVNLGTRTFEIQGCSKCGNKKYSEPLTEKNCNFGVLMNFLRQQKASDKLFLKLKEIEKDKDIQWLIFQRNGLLHRISEYRWTGLGIFPQSLDIKYEDGKEMCNFNLGSPEQTLMKEVPKIEDVYNKFVNYSEELALIFFPEPKLQ
jgi:hypothetical protein